MTIFIEFDGGITIEVGGEKAEIEEVEEHIFDLMWDDHNDGRPDYRVCIQRDTNGIDEYIPF